MEQGNVKFGAYRLILTSCVDELAEDPASLRMITSFVVGRVPSSRSFCPRSALMSADLPAQGGASSQGCKKNEHRLSKECSKGHMSTIEGQGAPRACCSLHSIR